MKIQFEAVDLELARVFETSRSRTSVSRSYFICGEGAVGEASPVRFYGDTHAGMEAALARLVETVDRLDNPHSFWPVLDRALGYNYSSKCGIDLWLWDLFGQREEATVRELLGIPTTAPVSTAFSIGKGDILAMQSDLKAHPDFHAYKLKVGFAGDVEAVRSLRALTDVPFYVDANGGWDVSTACAVLPELQTLGVVMCEQPIFSGRREDWQRVRDASDLPVIVDEYCQRPDDVAHWDGWVDGINVKLQKCGGITPAHAAILRARDLGLKVMIGCMIESSVGIAAAAQLAPLADYIDLDSNLYLRFDPYTGIPCQDGLLRPSGKPGLGVWETGR